MVTYYKFNGKEKDDETGLYYYGARYYTPEVSVWLSVDPLSDKYPEISPFAYCAGNPVRLIDPNGLNIDDYFNEFGKYLGTDNATSHNVKIISQDSWNAAKTINENKVETIDHKLGNSLSYNPSEIEQSTEAALSIYDHYNPTDLPLTDNVKGIFKKDQTGMAFQNDEQKAVNIAVDIIGLKKNKVSDNADEIINFFSHEKAHCDDFDQKGATEFNKTSKNDRERIAIPIQMKDKTFKDMRPGIQDQIIEKANKLGL